MGKVRLVAEAEPFANLSARGCAGLWNKFNDVAEGFGIGLDVFTSICAILKHELSQDDDPLPGEEIDALCRAVFQALDTDQNDLVDALEFLAAFALISALSWEEKVLGDGLRCGLWGRRSGAARWRLKRARRATWISSRRCLRQHRRDGLSPCRIAASADPRLRARPLLLFPSIHVLSLLPAPCQPRSALPLTAMTSTKVGC